MVSGLDSRLTSKESNDGQIGSDIGWRWCLLFVGEWGEACILFAFSNFYNIQTNTMVEAMAIRDGLFLSSLEAQEYMGRHHAMSRTYHNHYASILRRKSDSRHPCYTWIRVSFVSVFRYITIHNHDIIMALIPYHRCGMHFAYPHKTDNKAHHNPLGYTTFNHYSPHNHLTFTIYHPQVVRT
ncbi:unnamed protein product [Spirodela intermedia]|uniref:Uncharacterized protein n=1 Tax=Spirodela intermedia TaxID=51605 RepID=A0A7I8IXV1_SPIIN|nr:unnamed protein product [Spirodela intermedia]CAA6662423.1 unnamed protein product [Spirodela intermedia]